MFGISRMAEQLLASHEELSSMELSSLVNLANQIEDEEHVIA
jgi:hypothetical protein